MGDVTVGVGRSAVRVNPGLLFREVQCLCFTEERALLDTSAVTPNERLPEHAAMSPVCVDGVSVGSIHVLPIITERVLGTDRGQVEKICLAYRDVVG